MPATSPDPRLLKPPSPRELEIAVLLVKHLPDKEIADALGIGPGTVHTHLVRLRKKCSKQDRVKLGECAEARAEAWKGAAEVAEVRAAVLARARGKGYLSPEPPGR